MALWKEIERVRKNPQEVQSIATRLLALYASKVATSSAASRALVSSAPASRSAV
jgi:hypothetical protein